MDDDWESIDWLANAGPFGLSPFPFPPYPPTINHQPSTLTPPAGRQRWLITATLVGLLYPAVAVTSATLAGAAASDRMRFIWRLSAFIISAVLFAAHIAHGHFRLRNTARSTAWHTSAAVAFGAFVLALIANIHDLASATGYRPRMLIALAGWPLLTAVPAFFVALTAAAALARSRPKDKP